MEARFWAIPVGGTAVAMAAFLLFAAPLTWLVKRDPERLRKYRIQIRREREQRLFWPSIWRWPARHC